MATQAYNKPSGTAPNVFGVPKPSSKPLNEDGTIARDWWRFFLGLVAAPAPETSVILGASPTAYKASVNGTMVVTGGTVSLIQITRIGIYTTGELAGNFPLSVGDTLTITYTVAPTVTWFPR